MSPVGAISGAGPGYWGPTAPWRIGEGHHGQDVDTEVRDRKSAGQQRIGDPAVEQGAEAYGRQDSQAQQEQGAGQSDEHREPTEAERQQRRAGQTAPHELTPSEKAEVAELERRDREVKAHEQAHKSAGGPYARGGARYEYETGPDGRQYAVGG